MTSNVVGHSDQINHLLLDLDTASFLVAEKPAKPYLQKVESADEIDVLGIASPANNRIDEPSVNTE